MPCEKVTEIKGGKKRVAERKIYPGYVMAEIEVDDKGQIADKVWFMIKEAPGAGDLVGGDRKPVAMTDREVEKILNEVERGEEKPKAKIEFCKGDRVKKSQVPKSIQAKVMFFMLKI